MSNTNEYQNIIVSKDDVIANADNVSRVDELNGLELYCYNTCDSSSTTITKNCRGVVFDNDTLVLQGMPYTDEIDSSTETLKTTLHDEFKKYLFFDAYEGTLLRMFHHNSKWYISTHRKLDAFRSRWASKHTFGELFVTALKHEYTSNPDFTELIGDNADEILEKFQCTLNTSYQYMFLLVSSGDNNIVCRNTDSSALHVGTMVNNQFVVNEDCGLTRPSQHFFNTHEEVKQYVDNVNPHKLQGVMVFSDHGHYKIVNDRYRNLFDVRGNQPSIRFRYLQVRTDPELVKQLLFLYPSFQKEFDEYEFILFETVKRLYKTYVDRYVYRNVIELPPHEHVILKICHLWHKENRDVNKVRISKIFEVLNRQYASSLNKMIKTYKMELISKN